MTQESQEQVKIPTWLDLVPKDMQESLERELSQFEAKTEFFNWGISIELPYSNDWISITPDRYEITRFIDRTINRDVNAGMLKIYFDDYLNDVMITVYYRDYISRYSVTPAKMEIGLKDGKLSIDIIVLSSRMPMDHETDKRFY